MINDQELIGCIYKRLKKENIANLPVGLRGGLMGIALFMCLYSKYYKRPISIKEYLINPLIKFRKLPFNILEGKIGIGWGIRYLELQGFIEEDESLNKLYKTIYFAYFNKFSVLPVYWVENEPLFSIGVFMSQMFVKENSLKMYTIEELLIAYIDECEYLLLYPIRNIYSPKHMPLSMLHSLLFFLQEMNKYQIYPFMVNKLLNIIPSIYKSARNKNIIDEFVYRTLNHEYMNISNKISSDKIFYFLGEMGFYSLLYHSPEIFKNAYSQIEKQYNNFPNYVKQKLTDYSVNLDTLCGWGYGLLNN